MKCSPKLIILVSKYIKTIVRTSLGRSVKSGISVDALCVKNYALVIYMMIRRFKIVALSLIPIFFSGIYPADKPKPAFYNEILKFSIEVKGISVGSILMKTQESGKDFLQINTKVETFEILKRIYYIGGDFGAMWNYKSRRSYLAYEDIYQGYDYQRRAYKFQGNKVRVNKREVKYSEAGLPHDGKPEHDESSEYFIDTVEYQDLFGVFYTLRSSGVRPKAGETYKMSVLPAGVKKVMVIQVVGKEVMNVPALGGKIDVIHVRSGLTSPDQKVEGGNIFFNVKSEVDMYFTDDENAIPVMISARVPVIKRADVVLVDYQQTGKTR